MMQALQDKPHVLGELHQHIKALADQVALKSGLGLLELWGALSNPADSLSTESHQSLQLLARKAVSPSREKPALIALLLTAPI